MHISKNEGTFFRRISRMKLAVLSQIQGIKMQLPGRQRVKLMRKPNQTGGFLPQELTIVIFVCTILKQMVLNDCIKTI